MRGLRIVIACAAFLGSGAFAQDVPPASSPPIAPACCTISALTVVDIEVLATLNSRTSKAGDMFAIRLVEPIRVNGVDIVPSGTSGMGQVVHAAKARAAGKPGELILVARYLDIDGVRLPLRSLKYGPSTGKSNVDTAAVVGFAVATPLILVISGGEVNIPAGARANAKVSVDVVLAKPDPTQPNEGKTQ